MKRLLLWLAGSERLRRLVPRLWFARRAVSRFMPGDDRDAAVDAASRYEPQGIGAMLTLLGEHATSAPEAADTAAHYERLFETMARRDLHSEVSIKLTQLGLGERGVDAETAQELADRLASCARDVGTTIWIDMESSAYTDATIAVYEALQSRYGNVGLALQANLRRTASDLQRLLPLAPAIRLVKGAYAEAPTIAYTSKQQVDVSFVALAMTMIHAKLSGKEIRVALGTHDVELVDLIAANAQPLGVGRSVLEVQMLYGVRADGLCYLGAQGHPVSKLISYGDAWYAWYMRRLAERPANILFAVRELVPRPARARGRGRPTR